MLLGVRLVVQAGAVDKVGIFHAQLLGPLVHHGHEGLFGAGDMLGQGCGAVVGGHHRHGFNHVLHAHLLAGLQVYLTAALSGCGLRGDDLVVPGDAPGVQRLHHQQQRHNFGDTGGSQRGVSVFFIEDGAGGGVDQDGRRRGDFQLRCAGRGQERQQEGCGGPQRHEFFPQHKKSPFLFILLQSMSGKGKVCFGARAYPATR